MYSHNLISRQFDMAATELHCSSCGAPVSVEALGAGRQVLCPGCDRSISRLAREFDEDTGPTRWELDDFRDLGIL